MRLIRLLNYSENDSFRSNQKVVPISHIHKIYIYSKSSAKKKNAVAPTITAGYITYQNQHEESKRAREIEKEREHECAQREKTTICRRINRATDILFHISPKNSAGSHSFTSIK